MNHEQLPDNSPEPDDAESARSPEERPQLAPEIWVGSLSDYNNGDLHGVWMDAARPPEAIHSDIQAMLAHGPSARRGEAPEEWGIFDYEGFAVLRIDEYEQIEDVSRLALAVAEHGPAFAAWAEAIGRDEATTEAFLEAYCGRYDTAADYARELTEDFAGDQMLEDSVPGWLRAYIRIDYEAFARDLLLGGEVFSAEADNGGVYIFRGN